MVMLREPVFVLLVLAWFAGLVGVPWVLSLPVASVGLAALEIPKCVARFRYADPPRSQGALWQALAVLVVNCVVVVGIVVGWGMLVRWMVRSLD